MVSLDDSAKYMLTTENICAWIPPKNNTNIISKKDVINKQLSKNENIIKQPTKHQKSNIANNTDTLFWTFYCILYGEQQYEIDHGFQTEKTFKIKCIEDMRKIKSNLKTYKLKLIGIEDQLLNGKKIGIQALLGLALLFKKNILYVWNHNFFEFICSEENTIYIIHKDNNTLSYDTDPIKIKYYKDNYLQIENIDKPIKSITGYTKDDLILISKKLDININIKLTKNLIYQAIIEKI